MIKNNRLTQSDNLAALNYLLKNDFQAIFTALESIAKVQSVKSSNTIENNRICCISNA
jgi:hypothetical protein